MTTELTGNVTKLMLQKKKMEALQKQLGQSQLMKNEQAQTFIFDLKDYLDSLSLVTDLVPEQEVEALAASELATGLGEQQRTIQELLQGLNQLDDQEESFFNQTAGEVRRIIGSLQGILELNQLLLQDNRQFSTFVREAGELKEVPVEDSQEKVGFFQRLFGGKK